VIAPTFWQAYFISGAAYSLLIIYRRGFAERYRAFAAKSLHKTGRWPRIITGCVAMSFCTSIWPLLAVPAAIIYAIGFIAGALHEWGRRK
jgi:hypothetical protein